MNRDGQIRQLGRWFTILFILVAGPGLAYSRPGADLIQLDFSVPSHVENKQDANHGEPEKPKSIKLRQGETFTILIHGKILKLGYHTYPVEKAAKDQFINTLFRITAPDGFVPLNGIRETEPVLLKDKDLGEIYMYEDEFALEKDILIQAVKPGTYKVLVKILAHVCDEKVCVPVSRTFEVSVEVAARRRIAGVQE